MRWQSSPQPLLACVFPSRRESFASVTFPYENYFPNRNAPPLRLRLATRPEKRLFPAPLNCPPQTLPGRFVSVILLETLPSRFGSGILLETLSSTIRGAGAKASWGSVFAFGSAAFLVSVVADSTLRSIEVALASVRHSDVSSADVRGASLIDFGKSRSEGARLWIDEGNAMPAGG